ncbi:MAG: NAD(P)-binding domain-containing protein [Rikenellaceae bacterium]|nr:NAD(P)-binding domain-containing protein [Rikenellaceae bacterium]
MKKDAKFAVIGHGSWATALVKIILENDTDVGWYIRNEEVLEYVKKHKTNPKYLRDVHFYTPHLKMSSDINEVVKNADIIILAAPSAFLKEIMSPLTESFEDKFVVSAIKGIIPGEYITVAEYLNQSYGLPFDQIGIVSGPCHAEEVALERLSYLTAVCKDIDNSRILGDKIRTWYINVSYSTDIYGTEYATVLKNIYAIAVGMCIGQGYGDNFIAVLISNSAMEMERFLNETYPSDRNINASVYLGDLLVTSYSQFSRNRTFGLMVGKGYSVKNAQIEMSMVAEGYYAAYCINQINKKKKIRLPIADTVYRILYEGANPAAALLNLTKFLI